MKTKDIQIHVNERNGECDRVNFVWVDNDGFEQDIEIRFSKESGIEIRNKNGRLVVYPSATNVINVDSK